MAELPGIGTVFAAVLERVPREQQPLLIALAERLASDRYRSWAEQASEDKTKADLIACAQREEEIAERIESLYPNARSIQEDLLAANPEVSEINNTLFAPLTLDQQFEVQAQGERLGAATWRAFAEHATDPQVRDVFLGCALLEEQSAEVLESLLS